MELYIHQKVFSIGQSFSVTDAQERLLYTVRGKALSFGAQLTVCDATGTPVAFLRQHPFSFRARITVEMDGRSFDILRCFHINDHFEAPDAGWTMDGDFLGHDFTLAKDGLPAGTVHRQWMSWGDSYLLTVERAEDALTALCCVLAADCVSASRNAAAASSASI